MRGFTPYNSKPYNLESLILLYNSPKFLTKKNVCWPIKRSIVNFIKTRIEKYCHGSRKTNCAANSYTHVLFIVIINKPLLFLDVQSATPPKTPQETKNDVSISYS